MPGAEIDIGIGEADPALDIGRVFVSARQEGFILEVALNVKGAVTAWIFIIGEEYGAAAIFAGDIEAEIMAGVVAETEAPERRALDILFEDDEVVELEFLGEDVADIGIGGPDEALEVLRAGAADAGLRLRRRKAEICGVSRCRLAQNQGKSNDD